MNETRTPGDLLLNLTEGPKIPTVEDQEKACLELAARHDIKVVKVYVDEGISASLLTVGEDEEAL